MELKYHTKKRKRVKNSGYGGEEREHSDEQSIVEQVSMLFTPSYSLKLCLI